MGQANYLGIYFNWVLQAIGAVGQSTVTVASASFHIGMCMYIQGTVTDLRGRMVEICDELTEKQSDNHTIVTRIGSTLIEEIQFHAEILK